MNIEQFTLSEYIKDELKARNISEEQFIDDLDNDIFRLIYKNDDEYTIPFLKKLSEYFDTSFESWLFLSQHCLKI